MKNKLINHSTNNPVTRGKGILEQHLARLRAQQANKLIPMRHINGRVLDIGCGTYPYFLSHSYFKEKFAVEQISSPPIINKEIKWHTIDLNKEPILPFRDEYFDVVTMLAVIEHLNPSALTTLFREIHRTLQHNGVLIITTPAAWSDRLLKLMAKFNLVSKEEINEHVYVYTLPLLGWYFGQAGFEMRKVRFGYFEIFLNMWATAEK